MEETAMSELCFEYTMTIACCTWPIHSEDGSPGIPEIRELANGICPVFEGSKPLDPEDIEG